MARIISLVVLVTILAVIGALLFHVLSGFVLPVFLAMLLVVMFGPVHRWFDARCGGQKRISAALTTAAILLIVLVPMAILLARAVHESVLVYRRLNPHTTDIHKVVKPAVDWCNKEMNLDLSVEDLQKTVVGRVQQWLAPVALGTTQFVSDFLLGLLVMVFSLYYFLADGPDMIQSLVQLLPLDRRYSLQLVDQFITVSRAVVVATLLSAIVQGILAGIALYLAGFSSVFLLTVLAILMAMVPFVGPPIIWIPACLWLYFHEDRAAAAATMAVFGALVVSTVDNIVKPLVLHGRSKLHPLLALLSVLGGMQVLGPIGIFVGPMAVAFLQTLLNMLRGELTAMQAGQAPETD